MEVVEVVDVVERRFRMDGDIERVREAAERFGYELLGSLHSCTLSGTSGSDKQSFAYSALANLAINIYGRVK